MKRGCGGARMRFCATSPLLRLLLLGDEQEEAGLGDVRVTGTVHRRLPVRIRSLTALDMPQHEHDARHRITLGRREGNQDARLKVAQRLDARVLVLAVDGPLGDEFGDDDAPRARGELPLVELLLALPPRLPRLRGEIATDRRHVALVVEDVVGRDARLPEHANEDVGEVHPLRLRIGTHFGPRRKGEQEGHHDPQHDLLHRYPP